tara:strand:- start:1652 stop:2653 length:1002 start_codon:yes stop_codon:yes gene_type:complete
MHLKINLSKKILTWYDNNKRNLPWRVGKKSPNKLYYRLLSEFMLQQTQVKTVIPYFEKFTTQFKSLESLSRSNEKKILKLWEGLGYYRRAKNLLSCSRKLVNHYGSRLPKTLEEVKKLPGIGDYTGNALLGLVHNQPTIAIDGNVKRVISRILNKSENKIDFKKFIKINKNKLLSSGRNADFVEALMEFGALICKPKFPKCTDCCIKKVCRYSKSSNALNYTRKKFIKIKKYNIFCYLNKKKQIALTKNNQVGFLKNFNLPEIKEEGDLNNKNWKFLKNYKNSISNLKLNINLYYKFSKKIPPTYDWYSLNKNDEFIPNFTKKIFKQVSVLFS